MQHAPAPICKAIPVQWWNSCTGGKHTPCHPPQPQPPTHPPLNLKLLAPPHLQPGLCLRQTARTADFLAHFSILIKNFPADSSASGHAGKWFPVSPDPQDIPSPGSRTLALSWELNRDKGKAFEIQLFQLQHPCPQRSLLWSQPPPPKTRSVSGILCQIALRVAVCVIS